LSGRSVSESLRAVRNLTFGRILLILGGPGPPLKDLKLYGGAEQG